MVVSVRRRKAPTPRRSASRARNLRPTRQGGPAPRGWPALRCAKLAGQPPVRVPSPSPEGACPARASTSAAPRPRRQLPAGRACRTRHGQGPRGGQRCPAGTQPRGDPCRPQPQDTRRVPPPADGRDRRARFRGGLRRCGPVPGPDPGGRRRGDLLRRGARARRPTGHADGGRESCPGWRSSRVPKGVENHPPNRLAGGLQRSHKTGKEHELGLARPLWHSYLPASPPRQDCPSVQATLAPNAARPPPPLELLPREPRLPRDGDLAFRCPHRPLITSLVASCGAPLRPSPCLSLRE